KEVSVVGKVNAASLATTVSAATIIKVDSTLAQALAELKSAKPKAITTLTTTAATTITAPSTRPKAKELIIDEHEQAPTPTPIVSSSQSSQFKVQDKGKGIMVEEPLKMKKKDQISVDQQEAIRLQAKFDEKERLAKEKDEASIALTEEWNDIQRKEESTLQLREQKKKGIDHQQKLNKGLVEGTKMEKSSKRAEKEQESSSKRAGDELKQENAKKQKVDVKKKTEQEKAELQSLMEIVSDEEGVAIDAIPLATKPPSIVEWKILKEEKKSYYQIIRAGGQSKRYLTFLNILKDFDREDLETMWKLMKDKHGSTRPEEGYESVL
ncbi:hypothetical protein Tco_1395976, partial [Tanacetum coccineum]